MEMKKYTELSKSRITGTRKLIISRINNGSKNKYKFAELAEFKEGGRPRTMILRGGIEIESLYHLRNIRDAINGILDDAGYYETETGEKPAVDEFIDNLVDSKRTGNTMETAAADAFHRMNKAAKGDRTSIVPDNLVKTSEQDIEELNKFTEKVEEASDKISYESPIVEELAEDEWDDDDDWGKDEKEPLPKGYENYPVKQLYALCVERGLKASAKKSRSYYINILEKDVDNK